MKMGNFKLCAICGGAIFRNGISIHKAQGRGFIKAGKNVHLCCANRILKAEHIKLIKK